MAWRTDDCELNRHPHHVTDLHSTQRALSNVLRKRQANGLLMEDKRQPTRATFPRLVTECSDAGRIAESAVSTWRDLDAALSPIIGQRGVVALCKRSLYLTRADFPWLAAVDEGELKPDEFTTLQTALSQQTSANAAAANDALLRTFCDLLSKLIGASLTDRLLRSVWAGSSSDQVTQDT